MRARRPDGPTTQHIPVPTSAFSRRTALAGLGVLPMSGALALPSTARADSSPGTDIVSIELSETRQTIRGLGGMNHPEWAGDLTADQCETAFGRAHGQLGLNIARIYVNDDREQWNLAVPTALRAQELGAIVFASPWNPPEDMVETFVRRAPVGAGTLAQAETEAILENASISASAEGFGGAGYVRFDRDSGSAVSWENIDMGSAGPKRFELRYALAAGTRHLRVSVNDEAAVDALEFEPTGSWSTWGTVSVDLSLAKGVNTVSLETIGERGPSLDSYRVRGIETQEGAKRLKRSRYAAYARHLDDFVSYMKDNGVELHAISIQNEPDYAHEWTWWTPEELEVFLRENAASISTRVIAPESFQYVKETSGPILESEGAWKNVDILGAHLYGTAYDDFAYPLFEAERGDRELWMTEVYYPDSDTDSNEQWPESIGTAEHIHHAFVEGGFQTYVWWYIRRSYGPLNEDGTISRRGCAMAHFARFIDPGSVRVDVGGDGRWGVLNSAYLTPDGRIVVVAINSGSSPAREQYHLGEAERRKVMTWRTTRNQRVEQLDASFAPPSGILSRRLPPRSITTFVIG